MPNGQHLENPARLYFVLENRSGVVRLELKALFHNNQFGKANSPRELLWLLALDDEDLRIYVVRSFGCATQRIDDLAAHRGSAVEVQKRVPSRIVGEGGQDRPNPQGRRFQPDGSLQFRQEVFSLVAAVHLARCIMRADGFDVRLAFRSAMGRMLSGAPPRCSSGSPNDELGGIACSAG